MKPPQWLGAGILASVAAIVLALMLIPDFGPEPILIRGHVGNLKVPYFENPEVQRILRDKYGLVVEVNGMATTEMLCPGDPATLDGVDFLLAGEMSQVATYEECQNRQDPYKPVFLSPMVIYSWADTIDALVKIGVASQDESGAYHVDMLELLELMESDTTWEDLGLAGRPSQIFVHVTDPQRSSSGGTFSGLLANTMNCVEVVDSKTVEPVLPRIFTYYQGVGYLEPSSEALFRSYLTQGEGARPLVALLESQLSDYLYANPDDADAVAQMVRMLYPTPTVWTSHPFIARTELGEQLMDAMLDPELQQLGWEITGFRPSVPGVDIEVANSVVPGILPVITSVIDLPSKQILDLIKAATTTQPPDSRVPQRDCAA